MQTIPEAQTSVIRHRFCSTDELYREQRITHWVDALGDEITAVYIRETIYVVSSVCPHFGGVLEVDPRQCQFRCLWHDWRFDISTGNCVTYDVKTNLRHYPYEITPDGWLEIISK